jgi:hypothetical protein
MGIAEIAGFAICWLAVASLMLWGVFTENRRGGSPISRGDRSRPGRSIAARSPVPPPSVPPPSVPPPSAALSGSAWHPSRAGRAAASKARPGRGSEEWVVVDEVDGGSPEVTAEARLIAGAWLAARGVDMEALPPGDLRVEVTTSGDGSSTTRVLVRSQALSASRWRP